MNTRDSDRDLEIVNAASDPLLTLEEIGSRFGVTRERIRQILDRNGISGRNRLRERSEKLKDIRNIQSSSKAYRKKIWLNMIDVSRRQQLRRLAGIDSLGLPRRRYHMPGKNVTCQFNGCNRGVNSRGFCNSHYAILRSSGALWVKRSSRSICMEEGCTRCVESLNRCHMHYSSYLRKSDPNTRDRRKLSRSGNKNIYINSNANKKYFVRLRRNGKTIISGSFLTIEEAIVYRDELLGSPSKPNVANIKPTTHQRSPHIKPHDHSLDGIIRCALCQHAMRPCSLEDFSIAQPGNYYTHSCKYLGYDRLYLSYSDMEDIVTGIVGDELGIERDSIEICDLMLSVYVLCDDETNYSVISIRSDLLHTDHSIDYEIIKVKT